MRNPNAVLHIGWFDKPIAALQRTGAEVACVATAKEAPSVRAAGASPIVVPDPGSVADILAGLSRDSLGPADFAAVCSSIEFYLVQAAAIADLGGARGAGLARTLAMRDKFVQKELLHRAGVRTAACTLVENLHESDLAEFPSPRVLKPLDGAGAKDTFVLRSHEDLRGFIASTATADDGPWLLEEFVPGKEYFIDGVVRDGQITLFSLSQYFQNLIECHDGGLTAYHTLPEDEAPDLYAKTLALAESAFSALGYEDGVFHLEVFWDGTEVWFGECGARVGGGRADKLVELTFGVDLHDEWALAALGLSSKVTGDETRSKQCYGGLNLRSPQGRLEHVPSLDEVLARPGVVQAELTVAIGDTTPVFSTASNMRAGQAVVSGADASETADRLTELNTWFFDSIKVAP